MKIKEERRGVVTSNHRKLQIKRVIFFFRLLIFLLFLISLTETDGFGQPNSRMEQEIAYLLIKNQVLKQELKLASKPQLYFLFNLGEMRLELKARGLVLKKWRIARIRRWGAHPAIKILTLEKKSALFAPKRKKIKPGAIQNSGVFELEALEIKDMPTIYTLRFNEGLKIYVRPEAKNFGGSMASLGFFLRWYGWFPVQNLFFRIFRKPIMFMEISISSGEEAKAIYWALLEGMKGLIFTLPEKRVESK